jgi:hypothetical protein
VVRPSGFEPPTFCSGGIAAKRNLLILRIATQQFNRLSDYPPEKLLGKLLGRFSPFPVLVCEQPLEACMTGERGHIVALNLTVLLGANGARERRGKHSRNFFRPVAGVTILGISRSKPPNQTGLRTSSDGFLQG